MKKKKFKKFLMKNKKKLLISLAVLVVFLFVFFLVPFRNHRTLFQSVVYNIKVKSAIQAENYDKMKITYAKIKSRTTGTEAFNTPDGKSVDDGSLTSDMNGNDVSATDNYVRTFDQINYIVEVGIDRNEYTTSVDENLTGGIIKVKVKVPQSENGRVYIHAHYDSWMQSYKFNDDRTELTCYYVIPEGKSAVGAVQELSFTLIADGFNGELSANYMPEFEFWMEGNKNDEAGSDVESVTTQDDKSLSITGTGNAQTTIRAERINHKSEKDGKIGNYVSFGTELEAGGYHDTKGVISPVGPIKQNIKIEYYYKDLSIENSNWQLVDENNTKAFDIINGTQLTAYGRACEPIDNYWPTSGLKTKNTFSCSKSHSTISTGGFGRWYIYDYDSGEITANQELNYIKSQNVNNTSYSSYYGSTIIYNVYQLFVPYYDVGGSNYSYKIKLIVDKMSYYDAIGNFYSFDRNDSSEIELTTDLDKGIGCFFQHGNGYNYDQSLDLSYIGVGASQTFRGGCDSSRGNFDGGADNLITFNSAYASLIPYNGNNDISYHYNDVGPYLNDIKTVTCKIGVYKANPNVGLDTDELVNNALYEDFDWYDSIAEAKEHGVPTAIFFDDPKNKGNSTSLQFSINLQAKTDKEVMNKTGLIKQKARFYEDEDRTIVYSRGYNEPYTKAIITESGDKIKGQPDSLGQSFYISPYSLSISNKFGNGSTALNVQDDNIELTLKPGISYDNITYADDDLSNFKVSVVLPKDVNYKENSSNYNPDNVTINNDGTTTVEWYFYNQPINRGVPDVVLGLDLSPYLANNKEAKIYSYFSDIKNPFINKASNDVGITIINLAGASLRKTIDKKYVETNGVFTNKDYVYNISQSILNNVKTYEILPKNGDELGSKFSGSYTLTVNSLAEGQKLYYTTTKISNIPFEEDSYGNKNIQNLNLASDSRFVEVHVGDTIPSNATMLASSINEVSTMSDKSFSYTVNPTGNKKTDKYIFAMYASSDNLETTIHTENIAVYVADRTITGKVFEDVDRNNTYNEDKDKLLKNITLDLLDSNHNKVTDTTTAEDGTYTFSGISKGTYYIRFNGKTGYEIIPVGETDNSNKINSNGLSNSINQNENLYKPVVSVDNINLGIRKKEAHLTVKHLITGTNTSLGEEVNSTVYYTDEYTTSPLDPIPTNYKVDYITGITSGEVNKDNIEVIYYYTLKPSNIKVRYVDQDNNDIDLTKNIDENSLWGENYSYEPINFPYYDYVQSDGDDPSGTISADEITIIFKYKIKKSKLTIKYVDESGKDIDPSKNIIDEVINYGENYSSNQFTFRNYNFLRVDGDPKEGVVEKDRINVTYVYKLKECNFKVLYVDEDGNNIDSTKNIIAVKHWGETYSSEQLEFANYDFIKVEGEPSGTISSDELTITYKYKLKESTVTIRYIDEDGNDILSPIVTPSNYGKEYTSSIKDIPNYDYVRVEGDPVSGTISKDNILVRYIYKLKVGKVITHHYLYDGGETSTELAPDVEKEYKYTKEYNTTQSDKVTKNYEFYSKTNNYTGIMNANVIEVYYYYQLKDSTLSTNIEKTATEEITNKKDEVSYTINYSANVKEYIGDGVITIVEELPYAIDEEKSNLDGGTYNSENNTITWTIQWRDINTYNEADGESSKSIKKDITLVYEGIVGRDRIMTSNTNANIELSNNNREVEAQASTDIKIPGKVIVSYIDEETGKEIESELEESDLVGESVITTPIEKEGWELIEVPTTTELEYEEDVQTISYIYRRIKFEIITKALNQGGTIEGGEIVPYGDDSTKDKIVITSKEGYVIDKLFIDGEEAKTSNVERLVLGNFKEVKENHLVEVSFKPQPKVVNPFTSHPLISIAVILLIVGTVMTIYHRRRYILAKKR